MTWRAKLLWANAFRGRSGHSRPSGYAGGVLFFFGYGSKRKHLGPGAVRSCPRCHNTTQWARVREFKQLTVFFIPVARWKRRQFEVCGICSTAVAA